MLKNTQQRLAVDTTNMKQRKCESLYAVANDNPNGWFTVEELAQILFLSRDAILCCKSKGCSFPFGKSQPGIVTEFLRLPENAQLQCKDTVPKRASRKIVPLKSALIHSKKA